MYAFALALALTLGAEDDPVARAKEAFTSGQRLYKAGKYSEAVLKFEEANAAKAHPVNTFNIAKCYEQLGENGKALRGFRDYLRALPEAADKASVADSIANLERKLREKGVQQVLFFAEPASVARIEVDGKMLGESPASAELTAGDHRLVVRGLAHKPVERTVTVSLSRASEVTVVLEPEATDAPTRQQDQVALTPKQAPKDRNVAYVAPVQGRQRIMTWVMGGVGLAAVGAGVAFLLLRGAAVTDLNDCRRVAGMCTRPGAETTATQNRVTGFTIGSIAAFSTGAAALATAIVLFFLEGKEASAQ
jgi:tetratricopeptide (TPR) repeat protein